MTTASYASVVRSGWRVLVVFIMLGLAVAGALALSGSREYQAQVTLVVSARSTGGDASSALEAAQLASQKMKTYAALLVSRRVSNDVVRSLGLGMTPDQLTEKLSVETRADTYLLTLGARSSRPEEATRIADAVADSFTRLVAEIEQPVDRAQPPPVAVQKIDEPSISSTPASTDIPIDLATGALLGAAAGLIVLFARRRTPPVNPVRSVAPGMPPTMSSGPPRSVPPSSHRPPNHVPVPPIAQQRAPR